MRSLKRRAVDRKHGRPTDVRDRVFRAMHIKTVFTAADIRILSDADESYIRALIRRLAGSCDLENSGARINSNGRREKAFRVKNRDDFYIRYVKPD